MKTAVSAACLVAACATAVACWEIVPLEATTSASGTGGAAGSTGAATSAPGSSSTAAATSSVATTTASVTTASAQASTATGYAADQSCADLGYGGTCLDGGAMAVFFRVHDEAWALCQSSDMGVEGVCFVDLCTAGSCSAHDCDDTGPQMIFSSYCNDLASAAACSTNVGCQGNVAIVADPMLPGNCYYRDCGPGNCVVGPPAYCAPGGAP